MAQVNLGHRSMHNDSRSEWARNTLRRAPIALAVVALACGLYGFTQQYGLSLEGIYKAVITTLQLFVLNVGADTIHNGWARVASVLAPLSTAVAAWLAFQQRIRRALRRVSLRLGPGADDLVLGGGHVAAAIFSQAITPHAAPGKRLVVGVDPLADTPLEHLLADQHTPGQSGYVVHGDARSNTLLRSLNTAQARKVWVLTGDDLTNLDIARRVISLRREEREPPTAEQHVIVSIRQAQLARAQRHLWPQPAPRTTVHEIDMARLAARQLLMRHPPAYPRLGSGQRLHLCVLGHSDVSLALLAHAAAHCVYAEDPALAVRISFVSPQATQALQALYQRHPALNPQQAQDPALAALLPLATITPLDANPATLMPQQWLALQQAAPFDMVYVAAEHDLLTFAAARRALAVRDATGTPAKGPARIVACLNERGADPLGQAAHWPTPISTFNIFKECFNRSEAYPGEHSDQRAKVINSFYVLGSTGLGQAPQVLQPKLDAAWQQTTSDFRWSSRMAADHINVKLATLGLQVQNQPAATGATEAIGATAPLAEPDVQARLDAHLPALMRLEHRRFVAERLVDGWLPLGKERLGPDDAPSQLGYSQAVNGQATQKQLLQLNATLVPFEQLSADDQLKDERLIRAIPMCLRGVGEDVVASPHAVRQG